MGESEEKAFEITQKHKNGWKSIFEKGFDNSDMIKQGIDEGLSIDVGLNTAFYFQAPICMQYIIDNYPDLDFVKAIQCDNIACLRILFNNNIEIPEFDVRRAFQFVETISKTSTSMAIHCLNQKAYANIPFCHYLKLFFYI